MRVLRAWVLALVLVAAGVVSCASTPPPGARNAGDPTDDPCSSISCPNDHHCLGGTCVPGYGH